MNKVPADLHCHTKISDGSMSLEDLIMLAKRSNIDTIAITDHDTFAGTVRAEVLGKRFGVKVIPGIELSAYDYKRDRKVHILAYLCDYPDRLRGLCHKTAEKRKAAAVKMINKAMRYYPITAEMVAKVATGSTNIYKQHIMHALMNAGIAKSVFDSNYTRMFSKKRGLCTEEVEYPDVFEALSLIQASGGVSVLAHPSHYDSMDLLPELLEKGLDGVEVWHPRNTQEDIQILQQLAKEHNLIMTGGTDFHGMYGAEAVKLGTYLTPDDQLKLLLSKK